MTASGKKIFQLHRENFRLALVSVACQRFTVDQSSTCRQSQKGSNSVTVSHCESKWKIQVHTRTDSIAQQGSNVSAALTAQVSAKDFAQEDASDSAFESGSDDDLAES